MKELIFQKELILIKQVHQKNVCFVITGISKILVVNLNQMLKIIAVLNVKGVDYRCILRGIRNDAANILNNFVLEDKGVL